MKRAILTLTLSIFVLSCAKKVSPPPIVYYDHVVQAQGETLAQIAKWYTGSSTNWSVILGHNPGLDVKRIRIGTTIRIPESIVVRRDALPRKLVMQAADKAEEAKAEAAAADAKQAASSNSQSGPETQFVEKSTPAAEVVATAEPSAEPTPIAVTETPKAEEASSSNAAPEKTEPAKTEETKAADAEKAKSRDDLLKELLDE